VTIARQTYVNLTDASFKQTLLSIFKQCCEKGTRERCRRRNSDVLARFVEPIPALGIVPLRKTPKSFRNVRTPRKPVHLGPASAGLFLVRASSVPAIVLRQHHTQPFSCEDEEPRPNSA